MQISCRRSKVRLPERKVQFLLLSWSPAYTSLRSDTSQYYLLLPLSERIIFKDFDRGAIRSLKTTKVLFTTFQDTRGDRACNGTFGFTEPAEIYSSRGSRHAGNLCCI